jgi:hypothetical protein
MATASRRSTPIQLNYPNQSLSLALKQILGNPTWSDTFDATGMINLKWNRKISDTEKLKVKELLYPKHSAVITSFQPEKIEKGTQMSCVLRLLVSPDLI